MSFKKLIFSAIPAFALVATLGVGCKKSNSGGGSSSTLSATMGGSSFNAASANTVAWYSTDSSYYTIGAFAISNKDTTGLTIGIQPPFTLNTVITDIHAVNMDYYASSTQDYWGGNGIGHIALTVTSQDTVNHKIAGTFSATLYNTFNMSDSIQVTNGKFSTSYQVLP